MSRSDSTGCLAIAASVLIVIALAGLLRASFALLHHQTFYWTWIRANLTWLNPWQAIIGFGLILGLGLYILIRAIRDRRR
jgi:ABC-type nickel/cobalt efflux system permease component RcnA